MEKTDHIKVVIKANKPLKGIMAEAFRNALDAKK